MEISDGKLGALVFHLACSYPEALLQRTRDSAGNITLSGRKAHRGASPSQGTGQSIYLPVAWACLIQALSQVDLSPLPRAAGPQAQYRPPFFFILAKQSNLCQLSSTSETQGTLFMFHFEGRADILFVAYIPLSLYGLRFIICGFLISDTSTTALIPAQIDAFIGLHIQLSAGLPRAFSPQMSWI